jgi:hypothetical protein
MKKANRKYNYWRVVIVYTDKETSGNRVFKDLNRAKRWAARQEKSKVVKKCKIEPFTREPYRWRESQLMRSYGKMKG